jgi:hypothetical protein
LADAIHLDVAHLQIPHVSLGQSGTQLPTKSEMTSGFATVHRSTWQSEPADTQYATSEVFTFAKAACLGGEFDFAQSRSATIVTLSKHVSEKTIHPVLHGAPSLFFGAAAFNASYSFLSTLIVTRPIRERERERERGGERERERKREREREGERERAREIVWKRTGVTPEKSIPA